MNKGLLHHAAAGPEDAPVFVMASSLGTTMALWDAQVQALAARWRVVRFDLPGHGGSPVLDIQEGIAALARHVLALLDELDLERVSYCGMSIGGMIGMWLATYAPERLDRLALVCTSAHLPPAAAWYERAAAVRSAGSTEAIASGVAKRWLTPAFAQARPDVAAGLHDMLVSADPDGYAACCEAIAAMDLRPELPAITAPTLVIAGADDAATPVAHGSLIAATVSDGRLEILQPAAHLANVEQPDAVTDLLKRHLEEP